MPKPKPLPWPTPSSVKQCTQLHAHMIVSGTIRRPPAAAHLLKSMICPGNGDLSPSISVIRSIPNASTFLWNAILRATANYAPRDSVSVYLQMRGKHVSPDLYTFHFLFRACSRLSTIRIGQALHAMLIKELGESDPFVDNSLIIMYSELGKLEVARRVFDGMGVKNVVSWTTIISCYVKCGAMDEAQVLFVEMPERNVVSWTSMIAGFAQNGKPDEAIECFKRMMSAGVEPDVVSVVSVLSACGQSKNLDMGAFVHRLVDERRFLRTENLNVALIDMYAKCGNLAEARWIFDNMDKQVPPAWNALIDGYCKVGNLKKAQFLFDQMEHRDVNAFDSLITGYTRNCLLKEAFFLFSKLQASCLKPDQFTLVGLLTACANVGALALGKSLHAYILVNFIKKDIFLGTSLVDMYAKCGQIDQALSVFDQMPKKDVLSWTAMISGLAMNGHGRLALTHFSLMQREEIRPNNVTYIGLLTACSHSGLVEEGRYHFNEMMSLYNIQPEIEHYGCIIDLLSRAGHLEEAEELVLKMPTKPNAVIWGSMLSACRVHNHIGLAEKAAKHLLVLEPENDAAYVLLYNIYTSCGRWADAAEIRSMMQNLHVRKMVGCSSIVVDGCVHTFISGDSSHPQSDEIQMKLFEISKQLSAGYTPIISQVSMDVEKKEHACLNIVKR